MTILKAFGPQCCFDMDVVTKVLQECWTRKLNGADEETASWVNIFVEIGLPVIIG